MSQSDLSCLKCRGRMEQGYTLDQSHGATFAGQWVKGEPERSWLDFFGGLIIKTPNLKKRIPIGAFRCQTCGFLELYAREEFQAK